MQVVKTDLATPKRTFFRTNLLPISTKVKPSGWIRLVSVVQFFLIALYIAGFMARFVPSDVFWQIQILGVLLPFLVLSLLPFGLVLLFKRRNGIFVCTVCCIVLFGARLFPFGLAGEQPNKMEDLKVITYNVATMPKTGWQDLFGSDLPELAMFQESYFWQTPKETAITPYLAFLRDSLGYAVAPDALKPKIVVHENPIFVRNFSVTDTVTTFAIADEEGGMSYATRAVIGQNGAKFAVYNVHLQSLGDKKPWKVFRDDRSLAETLRLLGRQYERAYRLQAAEVKLLRGAIEKESLPYLIVGDFNNTVHNWAYAQLAKNMTDAYLQSGMGWGGTYHSHKPWFRIDHILVSREWQPISAHVLPVFFSDHRPVVAWIRPTTRFMKKKPKGAEYPLYP